jgi:hypothetical protein
MIARHQNPDRRPGMKRVVVQNVANSIAVLMTRVEASDTLRIDHRTQYSRKRD